MTAEERKTKLYWGRKRFHNVLVKMGHTMALKSDMWSASWYYDIRTVVGYRAEHWEEWMKE